MLRSLGSRMHQSAKKMCEGCLGIGRSKRLRIYVGGNGLAVCVLTGWFKPVLRATTVLRTTAADHDASSDFTAHLAALTDWLREHQVRGSIEWVMGIDHVHYLLLPWDERLSNTSFCHTLAAALFAQQTSGDDLPFSAYQLRFAPLSFGHPRLAALIADEVVSELNAVARLHRCRSRWISPALGLVWDNLFPQVKNDTGVLALGEGQRLLHVSYDHGQITSLSVRPATFQ